MKNDYLDLTIIIPVLNESQTINILVRRLLERYRNCSVIVTDDGSTDGTKEIVKKISGKNKKVQLLDRANEPEHGLTASVVDAALRVKTGKIIVMDGDLQHPPEKVGAIYKALDDNDLVVAVRTHIKNWNLHRKIISKSVSSFVYFVMKLRNKQVCNDILSGFFGIKSDLFKSIIKKGKRQFVGGGYKVLLDILRMSDTKLTMAEVEYHTFHKREYGKSKASIKQFIAVMRSTLR